MKLNFVNYIKPKIKEICMVNDSKEMKALEDTCKIIIKNYSKYYWYNYFSKYWTKQ